MSEPQLRAKVRRGLLKVEQLHALARAVYYGQRGRISAREVYDQMNACSCLTLILACIVYWQAREIEHVAFDRFQMLRHSSRLLAAGPLFGSTIKSGDRFSGGRAAGWSSRQDRLLPAGVGVDRLGVGAQLQGREPQLVVDVLHGPVRHPGVEVRQDAGGAGCFSRQKRVALSALAAFAPTRRCSARRTSSTASEARRST